MIYYKENLDVLRVNRPNLYNKIREREEREGEESSLKIQSVTTRDNGKALFIGWNHQTYRLNSSFNPVAEAEKWAEQFQCNNIEGTISLFGFGNGIFVRELLKRLKLKNSLVIYEPSYSIFSHVLTEYNIIDLLTDFRIFLIIEEVNETDFKEVLKYKMSWTNIKDQIVTMLPKYDIIFAQQYKQFSNTIYEASEKIVVNRNTEAFFGKTIAENIIKNLKCVKNSNTILELKEKLDTNLPAIIVSAGPSLDKNIAQLKEIKKRAIIFATDTAVKYLDAHQIIPDFIVTLDPRKPAHYLEYESCKKIPLFVKAEANEKILNNHKGKIIWFNSHPYLISVYKKMEREFPCYGSGGSVATGTFSICHELGFHTIVLIGQDLAFSGNITHAGGDISHIMAEEKGIRMIEGIDGQPIKTRHDWYIYLKWFEDCIQEFKELQVIDATEGGAKIHGTTILSLREVIDTYCKTKFDCATVMETITPTFTEEQYCIVRKEFEHSIEQLKEIRKEAREAVRLCEKLKIMTKKNQTESTSFIHHVNKVTKINRIMEKKLVYHLIDIYMAELTLNKLGDIYKVSEDEKQDKLHVYNQAIIMYETMIKATEALEELFDEEKDNF